MYKRLELNTLEIKILRFLFRPDFFSPKFYRAQRRFFFREKKKTANTVRDSKLLNKQIEIATKNETHTVSSSRDTCRT